jgi:hypothetical protein
MTTSAQLPSDPRVELPLEVVADIQDALLVAVNDLTRLDGLLTHAMNQLMARFDAAHQQLAQVDIHDEALKVVQQELHAVITDLQFQDMATQLINHTSRVLQGCAYKLAASSMDREEGEALPFVDTVPDRPNPVTQDEMHAGSIELF